MAQKDNKDPSETSAAYDAMSPAWAKIEALLGGTEAMRAAGELYLPRHERETPHGYEARINTTVLFNMTEQTLDTLVGKPFRDGMRPEDVPSTINSEGGDSIWDDVDLQGNDAEVFAKQVFREGLAKAFAHVLVDMPKPTPSADGGPRTVADDRREKRRPYWVMLKPECVLYVRTEMRNGAEYPVHVRIAETYNLPDGFGDVVKPRIRVLEPGLVEIWEPGKRRKGGKPVWEKTDEWATGFQEVPLLSFYADRQDSCLGRPPLLGLANLNIAHWQSDSDQRHILRVARFPILACSGATKDSNNPVVVGPNQVLYNEDPQGKFYYVEHTGTAIEAGRTDLEDLEKRMSSYGAEFLREKPGGETATAKSIDTAASTSQLSDITDRFEDFLMQVLSMTARMLGDAEGKGGEVELCKDYSAQEADTVGLEALDKARGKRDISRTAYLKGLMARNVLPEDFDPDKDGALLKDEVSELMSLGGLDLNPGASPPEPEPPPPEPAPGTKGKTSPAPASRTRKTA